MEDVWNNILVVVVGKPAFSKMMVSYRGYSHKQVAFIMRMLDQKEWLIRGWFFKKNVFYKDAFLTRND